jgi:hypothetical protein
MAGSLLPLKITKPVSSGTYGIIISHECEWASRYQFFAAGALWIEISHIFLLEQLKPIYCDLKSRFPLNLKINIRGTI